MSTAINNLTTQVVSEASRIRDLEEIEISALASLAEQGSDPRFFDLFCGECDEIQTIQGTARQIAEKVYTKGWMLFNGSPMCLRCQSVNGPVGDEDARIDEMDALNGD